MSKYLFLNCLLLIIACGKSSQPASVIQPNTEQNTLKQDKCRCPENNFAGMTADTIFKLSDGRSIALCGYRNEGKPVSWSEFTLADCSKDSIINFWNATVTAEVKMVKDTLIVEKIWNLPTGKNFEYKPTVYLIDRIYKKGNKTVLGSSQNNKLRKYTPAEIQQVLEEYKALSAKLQDDTMEMANKLFIAAISGSKKAHLYFLDFDNKFELDGAFAEEYKEQAAVLRFYVD